MRPAAAGAQFHEDGLRPRRQTARADPSAIALAEAYKKRGRLSFVVAVRQAFDFRAFSALFKHTSDIELVQCQTDLAVATAVSKAEAPDGVIIDVSYPNGAAFAAGHQLLKCNRTRTVAFFDERFAFWRAYKALGAGAGACYFTREFDVNDLCLRVRTLAPHANNSFISNLDELYKYDRYGLRSLSNKERLVMQWLACGHSVRGVAEKLVLAESTIDNHKSRIMSKLNVHRASELVGIAIETGWVDWH